MRPQISPAAFVRLIFYKDVRALRYPLWLLLAVAIAPVLLPLNPDERSNWVIAFSLAGICLATGTFLITIPAIQSDPAGREFRFLLTRPVHGSAIGLAKALFLTLFLIMPYWLSQEFVVACSQVSLTPLDHLLLLIESVVWCAAAVASLVLWCVFLRNGLHVVLVLVIFSVVGSFLPIWWHERSFHTGVLPLWPNLEHERLSQFRAFLSEAVFLVVAIFAIGLRYRTKGFKAPLSVALGGYGLSLLVLWFFPYNFAQTLEDQSSNRSMLTPDQLGRIHMTLLTQRGQGHQNPHDLGGGGWNGINYVNFNQSVRLEGVEPPYFVQTVGYHAVITLRSGKTFTSDYADFPSHGQVGGLNPSFMALVAGVLPSWPYQKDQQLDLATYLPKDLIDDVTGATIKGVITLEVRRAYVAGSIPLRSEASFSIPRRRYKVAHTDFSNDSVAVDLSCFQLPLILRGDLANFNTKDDLQWLAVYRPYSESLAQQGSSSGGGSNFGVHFTQSKFTYRAVDERLIPGWRPLPPDWASGAELVFIGSDPCGQVTLPYEIDNVDLNYRF